MNLYALYQIQQIFDLARNLKSPFIEFYKSIIKKIKTNLHYKDIDSKKKIEKKKEFQHNFQTNILFPFKKKYKLNSDISNKSIWNEKSENLISYLNYEVGILILTNARLENDQKRLYINNIAEKFAKEKISKKRTQ